MNKKILVPLDGSPLAEEALRQAKWLASKISDEILLVYIEKTADGGLSHMIKGYLESVAERTRKEMAGCDRDVQVEVVMSSGDPAEQILKTAHSNNVDLIAISTHGRSGLKRWALGSVCDRVVRGGNFPILVVRPGDDCINAAKQEMSQELLVTLDGSPQSEMVLPVIQRLATEMNLAVIVLRVISVGNYKIVGEDDKLFRVEILGSEEKPAEEYLDSVIHDLGESGITARSVLLFGRPADEITAFIENNNVKMMAMATHGRSGVSRWAMGSVAEKVLQEVRIPLLLVRN